MEAPTEDEVRAAAASLPLAQLEMPEVATKTQLDPYPGFGPR